MPPDPSDRPILSVRGFKSIRDETSIALHPLTLFCGANSSGKSAFMQPFLLVKQTLEVGYDPGPLFLDGPNVSFGRVKEMLWHGKARSDLSEQFEISFGIGNQRAGMRFKHGDLGIVLEEQTFSESGGRTSVIRPGMRAENLNEFAVEPFSGLLKENRFKVTVTRNRCFLEIALSDEDGGPLNLSLPNFPVSQFRDFATELLHLPGLRDLPARLYPATQIVKRFPGTFHPYVGSVIQTWAENSDVRLRGLNTDLEDLGLTWKVDAKRVDDTRVAIRVGRLPHAQQGGALDMVNLADVGLAGSQTLPILVALRVADRGWPVYLEQPEIHLHPRAQVALGRILVSAARRGVTVICETHSHLLIRAIQREIARSQSTRLAIVHWFSRDDDGATRVNSSLLDKYGGFVEQLPFDFEEVEAKLENEYLDLVQADW